MTDMKSEFDQMKKEEEEKQESLDQRWELTDEEYQKSIDRATDWYSKVKKIEAEMLAEVGKQDEEFHAEIMDDFEGRKFPEIIDDFPPTDEEIRRSEDEQRFPEILREVEEPKPEKKPKKGKDKGKPKKKEMEAVVKEKEEPIHKIPGGIIGQFFTCRKKGWRDRLWEVTPGGAKSDDDLQDMPDKMIKSITAITGPKRFVVLSGSDYSVCEKTKVGERELEEKWRGQQEESSEKFSMISHALGGRCFLYRPWGETVWKIDHEKGVVRDIDGNEKEVSPKMTEAIAKGGLGFTVLDESCNVVTANIGENNAWKDYRDYEEAVEKEEKDEEVDLPDLDLGDDKHEKAKQDATDVHDVLHFIDDIKATGQMKVENWKGFDFEVLGLMFVGNLLESKCAFRDKWHEKLYPGQFVMIVGPPSSRKTSGYKSVLNPIKQSKMDDLVISHDWTPEAAIKEIHDKDLTSCTLFVSEAARILDPSLGPGYQGTLKEVLLTIYDDPEYHVRRVDKDRPDIDLDNLSLSFCGTIQTERFIKLVTDDDITSGFFGRFSYIVLDDIDNPPIQGQYTSEQYSLDSSIGSMAREIRSTLKNVKKDTPLIFQFNEEGDSCINKWYNEIYIMCDMHGRDPSKHLKTIADRLFTMCKKMSMIYTVLNLIGSGNKMVRRKGREDWEPDFIVGVDNINKGIDYCNEVFRRQMHLYFKIMDMSDSFEKEVERFKRTFYKSTIPHYQCDRGRVLRRSDFTPYLHRDSGWINKLMNSMQKLEMFYQFSITNSKTSKTIEFIADFDPKEGGKGFHEKVFKVLMLQ